MIERIPDQIPVQTGEWRGTTFDIIPKETFAMACRKINELVDAVNELHEEAENNARIRAKHENLIDTLVEENNIHEEQIDELQMKLEPKKCEIPRRNMRPPYMQNKRLRKALSIAQSALVKLANDAYDFDEHIYIDKILNQIESITKGGDNE